MCRLQTIAHMNDFYNFIHQKDLENKNKLKSSNLFTEENKTNANNININIKSLYGDQCKINVNPNEAIQTLKKKIYYETGILDSSYSLSFNSIKLENDNAVQSYMIQNESIVYMIRDISIYIQEYEHREANK